MKVDELTFIGVLTALAAWIVYYLTNGGTVENGTVISLGGAILFNLSIFLIAVFGLQIFQLGLGRNIQKEIFDDKNMAAAIYQGALFIGIALIISKAIGI